MRSFRRSPDNRRAIYLNLIGSIESQLRKAFAKRSEEVGFTQADLARKLGVDKSVITRRLTGRSNMTAETIADMVWGLGHCIKVEIFDPGSDESNQFRIVPYELDAAPRAATKTSSVVYKPAFHASAPMESVGG